MKKKHKRKLYALGFSPRAELLDANEWLEIYQNVCYTRGWDKKNDSYDKKTYFRWDGRLGDEPEGFSDMPEHSTFITRIRGILTKEDVINYAVTPHVFYVHKCRRPITAKEKKLKDRQS